MSLASIADVRAFLGLCIPGLAFITYIHALEDEAAPLLGLAVGSVPQ